MKKIFIISLTICVFFASVLFSQQPKLKTCKITLIDDYNKTTELTVEIAKTDKEKAYGLMNRPSLDENSGMLFVFSKEDYLNFWMKNVSFPLSIAYINGNGIIQEIQDMKEKDSSITYPSKQPSKYALEVNKGFFNKKGIKAGHRVIFDGCFSK